MTIPNFISFTDANGDACQVSNVGEVSSLSLTPSTSVDDSTVCTRIRFSGGGFQDVAGTVAATATALGIAATSGPVVLTNTPQGTVALASYGTDAVSTADTWYWSEGFNPVERTVTNIMMLNGTTAATDKAIYAVWNAAGTVLGWTTLAGVVCANGDTFQSIAAVTPFTLPAGKCWAGFVVNGTTTAHQTVAAATFANATGTTAGTFGEAVPNITPTTSTTAGVGPFWRLS